jgi:hypothetical protein
MVGGLVIMARWIVHYTSMVIEASSPDVAIDAAQESGGGHWEAERVPLDLEDFVADEENDFPCPLCDAYFSPKEYLSIASLTRVIEEHIRSEHAST